MPGKTARHSGLRCGLQGRRRLTRRAQTPADGSIWIVVPGTTPLSITVRLTAPAVPGYSKMDIAYRYSTR